jgi:hypothetical protein
MLNNSEGANQAEINNEPVSHNSSSGLEALSQSVNSNIENINSSNDISEQTSTSSSQSKLKQKCKYGNECYR